MTDRDENERLLNATGRTLEGLPKEYPGDRCREVGRAHGLTPAVAGNSILHQSDVIELLVGALRDALDKQPKWISVKERLPTGEDPVLILVKETEHFGYNKEKRKVYYCQYLAYWDGDEWFTTWCNGCRKISDTAKEPYADDYEVTHWMPLPEPPEEEANETTD